MSHVGPHRDTFAAIWRTRLLESPRRISATGLIHSCCRGSPLDTVAEYAGTGVDYFAVGALTHSVRVLDIGLDV
jgi:nicotinate-nucleotide pyrophosphorylase (carboxylating)